MSWLEWLWKKPDFSGLKRDPPKDEPKSVPKQDKEDEYTRKLDKWLAFDGRSGPFGDF
jgi:hypothetical protein